MRVYLPRFWLTAFGLTTSAIGTALKISYNGLDVSTYYEGDEDYDITVTLANGQVWQQRYKTTWRTEMTDPEVIITRHLFGLHRMEVVGTGQTVPVKRIR